MTIQGAVSGVSSPWFLCPAPHAHSCPIWTPPAGASKTPAPASHFKKRDGKETGAFLLISLENSSRFMSALQPPPWHRAFFCVLRRMMGWGSGKWILGLWKWEGEPWAFAALGLYPCPLGEDLPCPPPSGPSCREVLISPSIPDHTDLLSPAGGVGRRAMGRTLGQQLGRPPLGTVSLDRLVGPTAMPAPGNRSGLQGTKVATSQIPRH